MPEELVTTAGASVRRYALKSTAPRRTGCVDFDKELNDEQRAVALCEQRPTLVVAGAGSGKTRTLTYRVAHLIESGVAPDRILLLTFTNKSAREMMARAGHLTKIDVRKLSGGTFHHVAHSLLRDHAQRLGYGGAGFAGDGRSPQGAACDGGAGFAGDGRSPQGAACDGGAGFAGDGRSLPKGGAAFSDRFGLLDREDSKEVMASATADLGLGVGQRRFPRADVLVDLYSSAVNTQRPLVEVITASAPQFVALEEEILKVVQRFQERKLAMNAMDFDDLLLNWKRLLQDPLAREALQRKFAAVLVDEYQDTNLLQGEIVDAMAERHQNLLVVGDDAQSIYAFRGAHFDNILRFPNRYPGAQQFQLTKNYRSTPQILALANASIACNVRQFPKELSAARDDGVRPALVPLRDVHQQAEFVAQRILELREEGIALKDLAVLYRAHNHAMELQMELTRRGIPYLVRAGVRFFEQAHIKDVLAHLRFIANPHDELAFKRVVKLAPGIGAASADALWTQLQAWAKQGRDPRADVNRDELDQLVPPKARAGLKRTRAALSQLQVLRSQPSEMIRYVLHEGGYAEALKVRYTNAPARYDDVVQLSDYALQAEGLDQLLGDLTLLDSLEAEDVIEGSDPDEKVTLSSVHQAKGLEWRAVFLVWLADGRFPSAPALRDEGGEEEERRLFYVGVTRARDELYLCYPILQEERDQARILLKPSRFLDELPVLPSPPYEKWSIELELAPPALPE